MDRMLKDKKTIMLLFLPGFLVFLFTMVVPVGLALYYSFTEYKMQGTAPVWIGLDNYIQALKEPLVWNCFWRALQLALGYVLIQHPLAFLLAAATDRIGGRTEKFLRVALFIPSLLSVAVTSILWVNLYNPSFGLINQALKALGLNALAIDWLGNPATAYYAIIVTCIWQGIGWSYLIYYSGIKGIPADLYEAARMDGAGWLRTLKSIVLPLMKPVILVNLTLAVVSAIKQMETVNLTTNGGPGKSTEVIANYIYKTAFTANNYGYGMALSVLFIIVCLFARAVLNRMMRGETYEY